MRCLRIYDTTLYDNHCLIWGRKDWVHVSMVARNTGPLSRSIKVETIERKVVVGSAVQKHGFIFDYTRASSLPDRDSSSDSADSF